MEMPEEDIRELERYLIESKKDKVFGKDGKMFIIGGIVVAGGIIALVLNKKRKKIFRKKLEEAVKDREYIKDAMRVSRK